MHLALFSIKKVSVILNPKASEITKLLPPFVKKIGVFSNEDLGVIRDITGEVRAGSATDPR